MDGQSRRPHRALGSLVRLGGGGKGGRVLVGSLTLNEGLGSSVLCSRFVCWSWPLSAPLHTQQMYSYLSAPLPSFAIAL